MRRARAGIPLQHGCPLCRPEEEAQAVYDNSDATAEQVNTALENLEQAQKGWKIELPLQRRTPLSFQKK